MQARPVATPDKCRALESANQSAKGEIMKRYAYFKNDNEHAWGTSELIAAAEAIRTWRLAGLVTVAPETLEAIAELVRTQESSDRDEPGTEAILCDEMHIEYIVDDDYDICIVSIC